MDDFELFRGLTGACAYGQTDANAHATFEPAPAFC